MDAGHENRWKQGIVPYIITVQFVFCRFFDIAAQLLSQQHFHFNYELLHTIYS